MDPHLIKKLETGFTAQQRGDLQTAEKQYREVLRKDPANEFALNLLGVVLIRRERHEDAANYLERARSANATDPETHNNLGLAYSGMHRFPDAIEAFRSSLKLAAKQPQTLNNLGNALAAIDQHKDAVASFQEAARLAPDYADCLNNLAVSLLELGSTDAAMAAVDKATTIEPKRSQFHNTRGEILLREAKYEQALAALTVAIELDHNVSARLNSSTALKQLGRTDEAERVLTNITTKDIGNAEAHHHLGVLLEQLGRSNEAADAFRAALAADRRHASSYYQLSRLRDQTLSGSELEQVRNMLDDPSLLAIFRSSLLFALATEHEKRKEYDDSIRYFIEAQSIKSRRCPYQPDVTTGYVALARKVFPVRVSADTNTQKGPVPLFVVGMPRSGTTLTEQILVSHSRIEGAGEVGFIKDIAQLASKRTGKPFPVCVQHLAPDFIDELRETYLEQMKSRCGTSDFVVDKNPLNFNFIGLIATVFPEARILFCKRNPMDNCVSIFRLPFDDNQGYSHDLAALGHFYRQHEELMDHWLSSYPDQVVTVQYEDTVDDLEQQARRMLDFVGVDFEDEVLRFFDTERAVLTPSSEQVRQPIYKTSVDAWRRYGDALAPLIEALD